MRESYESAGVIEEAENESITSVLDKSASLGSKRFSLDLTKNMLLVFSSLVPNYPWCRLLSLLEESCTRCRNLRNERELFKEIEAKHVLGVNEVGCHHVTIVEVCTLLEYMMIVLPLDTQQHLQGTQMPKLLSIATCLFTENIEWLAPSELHAGLTLCRTLLKKLIPSVTQNFTEKQDINSKNPINSFRGYSLTGSNLTSILTDMSSVDIPNNDTGIIQIGIEAEKELEKSGSFQQSLEMRTASPTKEGSHRKREPHFDSSSEEESFIIGIEEEAGTISMASSQELLLREAKCQTNSDSNSTPKRKNSSEGSNIVDDTENVHAEASFLVNHNMPKNSFELEASFLYKYITEFEKFFLEFVKKIILDRNIGSLGKLESLLIGQVVENCDPSRLNNLMNKCLSSNFGGRSSSGQWGNLILQSRTFEDLEYKQLSSCVALSSLADSFLVAFKIACTILVELSSLPAVSTFPTLAFPNLCNNNDDLPAWLLALISCITGAHDANAAFTHTAISTFLELVALAQSDLSKWKTLAEETAEKNDQGVTAIRMLPLLTPSHIYSLISNTYIFQVSVPLK